MKPFVRLTAPAIPLVRDNIDTDAIIPSREMRSVGKTGLADGLFAGWRYRAIGGREIDPAFVLNDPRYADAQFLLAGSNFGCGSSREHAVWALAEYGFHAIVAVSFNPIFYGNCVRNGVVPVQLPAEAVATVAGWVSEAPTARPLTVDLEVGVLSAGEKSYGFVIDDESRTMLLHGLDVIALTLRDANAIEAARAADARKRPWAYRMP